MFYINIFIKKICFYSFFTYLGLFWNKISNSKNRKKINKILFFVLIISLVGYIFLMFTNYFVKCNNNLLTDAAIHCIL